MNETIWLTVDEASLLCREMGLNRTKKTMRNWAKNKHLKERKQTTHHGEMWVLEKSELISKIKAELEFAQQHRSSDLLPETSAPFRNVPHPSGNGQTLPETSEPVRKEPENGAKDGDDRDKIRSW